MFLSVDHSFFLFIFNPQAKSVHEGNYSCSLPGYMSAHVRIHMIRGKRTLTNISYYALGGLIVIREGGLMTPILWDKNHYIDIIETSLIFLFSDKIRAFVAPGNVNLASKLEHDLGINGNIAKVLYLFITLKYLI